MNTWNIDYVVKNPFSRSGKKLTNVKGIVIHWTGNKGGTDTQHQDFFDGPDGGGSRYASAHLFVDKDSSTLIIPLGEVAYHANEKPNRIAKLGKNANYTTIGVEMCVEKDGTIHPDTVARTVQDVAKLCKQFQLNPLTDIYRHYDVTGKNCPAPWVTSPAEFITFKAKVFSTLNPPKPTQVHHTVQRGEYLSTIAIKYKTTIAAILKLNKDITDPNKIKVGQKVRVK